jgi:hypothetical protein
MSILLGLSPFLTFFALMRLVTPIAGLIGALAVSSLLCLRMWRRSESVKILEVGSLILFGLLTGYTLLAAPRWTVATVRLAVDGGLLGIALVSLAIDRPLHAAVRAGARAGAVLGAADLPHHQPHHHRGLGRHLRGPRGRGRRRGIRVGDPHLARRRGLDRGLRGRGLVQPLVPGRGSASRPR